MKWFLILKNNHVVPSEDMPDVREAECCYDSRRVGRTEFHAGYYVSTVFLPIDHSYHSYSTSLHYTEKPCKEFNPTIWESMPFGGSFSQNPFRSAGIIHNARRLHIHIVKKCLRKDFHIIIRDNTLLDRAFPLGFAPKENKMKPPIETEKVKKVDSTVYKETCMEKEKMEITEFIVRCGRSLPTFIDNTNWAGDRYSSLSLMRKGESNKDTGLCRLLVNSHVVRPSRHLGIEAIIEDVCKVDFINTHEPTYQFDVLVDEGSFEKTTSIGVRSQGKFQEHQVISVHMAPYRMFVKDLKTNNHYRLWVSTKYTGLYIIFGKYGVFLFGDGSSDNDVGGYHTWESYSELSMELDEVYHKCLDIHTRNEDTECIYRVAEGIYESINNQLDDPYICPETDLEGEPLHYLCGSEEGLESLSNIILQATLPDEFWSINGEDTAITFVASCQGEEARVDMEDSYEERLIKFIMDNPRIEDCLDEALTQNEPQGYSWEYNDGASDRKSGYSINTEKVTVGIEKPSAHEKLRQLASLNNWCIKYGLVVP